MKPPAGRDRDAADDDRRRRADRRHLAAAGEVEQEPDEQRAGRGQQRVGERQHAGVAGREAAAAVEAEPAEPQQPGAEQHVDRVVRKQRLASVVLAGADDERRRQRREARAHLDGHAAGEVQRPLLHQPATAERPVRHHGIDEHRPERGEHEKRAEAHPLDDGARDERGRDDAERRLEGEEDEVRDRRAIARIEADVGHEGVAEAAEDLPVAVEGQRIADERPGDRRDGERRDAHHERVQGVLRAHEARVEEPEADRHEQDERRRDEHPGGVARVDRRSCCEDVHHVAAHRRDGAVVALAGADPDRAFEIDDEDLAVADLAGLGALAERLERRLDELVRDGDLEADLLGETHLHARAAIRLDAIELAAVALDAAQREPAHLGAVEGLEHVVDLVRSDDADDELHAAADLAAVQRRLVMHALPARCHTQARRPPREGLCPCGQRSPRVYGPDVQHRRDRPGPSVRVACSGERSGGAPVAPAPAPRAAPPRAVARPRRAARARRARTTAACSCASTSRPSRHRRAGTPCRLASPRRTARARRSARAA